MICLKKYSNVWCLLNKTPNSGACLCSLLIGASSTLLLESLPSLWFLLIVVLIAGLCAYRLASALLLLFFLIGFSNAVWQFSQHRSQLLPEQTESLDLVVTGVVDSLPVDRHGDIKFQFRVEHFERADLAQQSGALIQLSCYRCPFEFRAGEQWRLTVRLKRPHGFASAGAFDYQKYLFRHKIIGRGSVRAKLINTRLGNDTLNADNLRYDLGVRIDELAAQAPAGAKVGYSLIKALAIGDKSSISTAQSSVLQKTGVSHLIAISGLHIGLVFACVLFLANLVLRPFTFMYQKVARQQLAIIPALMAAVFYASLAGFAVSTQRALLMLLIFSLSRLFARPMPLLQVLMLTATLLVLIDPFSVLDHGFWLSFGAVLVIALSLSKTAGGNSSASKSNAGKTSGLAFRASASSSINLSSSLNNALALFSLQPRLWLGMMPLLALLFGQVSLVSPLVNVILVPIFCSLLIPLTLLAMVFINSVFAVPAGYLLDCLASLYAWIFSCLEMVASADLSTVHIPKLSTWLLFGFAWTLLSYIYRFKLRHVLMVICLLGLLLYRPTHSHHDLRVSLLDVGQGLSMVIQVGNYTMVYDTGPRYLSGFTTAEAVVLPFLRQHGVTDIDDLVISHADNDHIGGYHVVVNEFEVHRVYSSRQDKLPDSQACHAGMRWQVAKTEFSFLSPEDETPRGSNNWSCVLMLEHAGRKVLITGDIEKQVERFMLQKGQNIQADVMLVPHQGSKTSSSNAFITAVDPQLALVAAGYKNHYGHPNDLVLDRYNKAGVTVLSTIEHGTIDVLINDNGVNWTSQRTKYRRFWH